MPHGPRARRFAPARLPVYLFPCRIQQGWGDIAELAQAAWALHRARFPLYHLLPESKGLPARVDARAQPIDPSRSTVVRFPPVARLTRPLGRGRAATLTTWWGVTARREDAHGGPLPGTLARQMERLAQAHGPAGLLHVSLEEFAGDQSSVEALEEGLRQAGWSVARRRMEMASEAGRRQLQLYHDAFVLARAGERPDLLHLVSTLAPDRPAAREFPFLLPVGPFGDVFRPRRPAPAGVGRGGKAPYLVVWYASPDSAPEFARRLLPALAAQRKPVRLEVRAPVESWARFPLPPGRRVSLCFREEMSDAQWARWWDSADLRVATGSQTLTASVRAARPFLYFNGVVQGPGERPRGFRREKLLSLLRGLAAVGVPEEVSRDLERFADGRGLRAVLARSLRSEAWRRSETDGTLRLRQSFPPTLASGDAFLVSLLLSYANHPVPTAPFVEAVRESHARALFGA